jgi:hypothetical protein
VELPPSPKLHEKPATLPSESVPDPVKPTFNGTRPVVGAPPAAAVGGWLATTVIGTDEVPTAPWLSVTVSCAEYVPAEE